MRTVDESFLERKVRRFKEAKRHLANDHGLEYDLAMLRMYAHVVDKGLQADYWEPGRGCEAS
ncbi:MAG: hypothetical protein R6U98_07735 [Pirellulaceae bacterium]